MEDEWEDMNLASLRPDPTRTSNFNFQEFLTRPVTSTNPQTNTTTHVGAGYTSPESPLPPPPATALSLNSCPGHPFGFPFRPDPFFQAQPSFPNGPESLNVDPFDGLASSCSRIAESEVRNTGDRRNKRMIKNRESAARSRARKQAYTNELELEVAHLMEENARLKREQQQLHLAAATQLPKRHSLHRSSTAPF